MWPKIIKKTAFLWKFEKTCSTCKRLKSLGIGTMTGHHATIYMKEVIDYWVTNYWEFNNQNCDTHYYAIVSPYKASSNQIVKNDNAMYHGQFWCKMNSILKKKKSVTKF